MSDELNPVLDMALTLLGEGFSVVPCDPGIRYPSIPWTKYQHERATVEQAREWWGEHPWHNIAIVTGEISGVTVLDVDGEEGFNSLVNAGIMLPSTRVVKTPHGWHLWYRYVPGPKSRSGVYTHVDVKNDGGCVCVPPSRVSDGEYAVFRDYPMGEWTLPVSVLEGGVARVERAKAEGQWITKLLEGGEGVGGRNQAAAKLAGYLHSKGVAQDIATLMVECWDDSRNLPALGPREIEATVKSVYRYKGILNMDDIYHDEG